MFATPATPGCVLCCLCGISIPPNPANMCANCIRSQARNRTAHFDALSRSVEKCDMEADSAHGALRLQVDITEGVQKQCTVLWCKECNRWLQVLAP